jgi:hypothetical protein
VDAIELTRNGDSNTNIVEYVEFHYEGEYVADHLEVTVRTLLRQSESIVLAVNEEAELHLAI